jgi:hypothetical protein
MKREKKVSVLGLFHDQDTLGRAVETLQAAGFPTTDISALLPRSQSTAQFAHEHHTKAPEGAAAGAATGGVVGGGLGLLVGLGMLAIPGLGPLLAAGPIVAALAGVGAGGAVGGIAGALVGMGIPEYEAKRYESFITEGGMLLSVHCDDEAAAHRAKGILDGFGATGVDEVRESHARHARKHQQVG